MIGDSITSRDPLSGHSYAGWTHTPYKGEDMVTLSSGEQWLENVVLSGLDVSILGMPVLLSVVLTPAFATERQSAALVALLVLTVGVGTIRGQQGRFAARWPRTRGSVVLARAAYYNVTLALAAYGGAVLAVYGGLAAGTGFAAVLAGIAAGRLPQFRTWADQSLPYQGRVDEWDA